MANNMDQPGEDFWRFEAIGKLVIWRTWGWTFEVIAQMLGTTRDAVVGKAHRLNLPAPPTKPPRFREPMPVLVRPKIATPRGLPFPIKTLNIRYLDRRSNECAAILDKKDDRGLPFCCGLPTLSNRPWCQAHFDLYTEPMKEHHGQARQRHQ